MNIYNSPAKVDVIEALPTNESDALTYDEIAAVVDRSNSTIRDHMRSLIDAEGVDVGVGSRSGKKTFYLQGGIEHPTNANPSYQEQARNKAKKTRKINEHVDGLEGRLRAALNDSQPAVADGGHPVNPSNEDVVIHRTDPHFGDCIHDEYGNVVFDTEIVREREEHIINKVLDLTARQGKAGVNYDTAHLLLGGDIVTGESTYEHQAFEIELTVDEQIDAAYEVYINHIERLADHFPAVQVVCQPGNHGAIEGSYSNGANFDRLLYMMLDRAVRMADHLDNVTFIRNSATEFTNFYVRGDKRQYEQNNKGWKFHLRHGDNSLEHIGTSSGKQRWQNWLLTHEFDQAYRGHYHKFELDSLHGDTRVIMTGSPKPPDWFEESIGEWTTPSATIHGVSDKRELTWMYPVEFSE